MVGIMTSVKPRVQTSVVDIVCTLMIGFGLGALGMYWYAVSHPSDVIQAQPHVLIAPSADKKAANQKKEGNVPTKAPIITFQI